MTPEPFVWLPPILAGLVAMRRRPTPVRLLLAVTLGWGVTAVARWVLQWRQAALLGASWPGTAHDTYYDSTPILYLAGVPLVFLAATAVIWLQTWAGRMVWPGLTMGVIWVWVLAIIGGFTLPSLIPAPQDYTAYEAWFTRVHTLTTVAASLVSGSVAALFALLVASILRSWLRMA